MKFYRAIMPVLIGVVIVSLKIGSYMQHKKYARELFEKEVSLVRQGQIYYEEEARDLAEKYRFSLEDLENALETGRRKKEKEKETREREKFLEEYLNEFPYYKYEIRPDRDMENQLEV